MAGDDYSSLPSTGKLKLKGVADGRVDKKKKKKKPKPEDDSATQTATREHNDDFKDNSVVLQSLADEDEQISKSAHRETSLVDAQPVEPGAGDKDQDMREHLRTESQKRFEEQRRKRLEERLKREGVKTHKQRVEELNKYLSSLSEHHDMPKIGPG